MQMLMTYVLGARLNASALAVSSPPGSAQAGTSGVCSGYPALRQLHLCLHTFHSICYETFHRQQSNFKMPTILLHIPVFVLNCIAQQQGWSSSVATHVEHYYYFVK
jgi:hypothetical protein